MPSGERNDYMHKRGFTDETMRKFGIGYAPGRKGYGGDEPLAAHLTKCGFKLDDCVGAGVLMQADNGYFVPLARRLIVPIFNMQGKVIAFGGRGIAEREISRGK